MARRMMCAVCDDAIDEDGTTLLRITLKPPPKDGVATPAVDVSVDLCSSPCLQDYLGKHTLKDLGVALARWKNVGISPTARRLPPCR